MPDPIVLPHPIRSEQERENVGAAYVEGWRLGQVCESWLPAILPPVEPLPELAGPWGVLAADGQLRFWNDTTAEVAEQNRCGAVGRGTLTPDSRVVRLAVVEVLDPEPEPPKAAPSGWVYRVIGGAIERYFVGKWYHVAAAHDVWALNVPPVDMDHVAALLREAEHGK